MNFLEKLFIKFSNKNRDKKWNIFLNIFKPEVADKVLDVGFCEDEYKISDNYIEKKYLYKKNLTALGLEAPDKFSQRYPEVKTVKYDGGVFPFLDKAFDIAFSSAVIEHVGGDNKLIQFFKEMRRVSHKSFLTTPNKFFPIEVHTRVLLLHFLPKKIFDKFLKLINKEWATGSYMNLLSLSDIKRILRLAGIKEYKIIKNKFLFFTLEYIIIF